MWPRTDSGVGSSAAPARETRGVGSSEMDFGKAPLGPRGKCLALSTVQVSHPAASPPRREEPFQGAASSLLRCRVWRWDSCGHVPTCRSSPLIFHLCCPGRRRGKSSRGLEPPKPSHGGNSAMAGICQQPPHTRVPTPLATSLGTTSPLCQPLMVPDFSITRPFQGPSIRQFASHPSPCTGTHRHMPARVRACLASIREEGMERETKNTRGIPARSHTHSSQHWSKETIPSTGKHSHPEKPLTLLPELSAEFSMFIRPENSLPPSSSRRGWIFPSLNCPVFYPEQIK